MRCVLLLQLSSLQLLVAGVALIHHDAERLPGGMTAAAINQR
jgi:hypothetical protein